MSNNYASGLSAYDNKGKLGLPEKFDSPQEVESKVRTLAGWIRSASGRVVFHTGAGISTAAGLPDFRGPRGVWTLERRGRSPPRGISWDEAVPTRAHRAMAKLVDDGKVAFVNIDGLHMRSGLPRACLAELHGNMFADRCNVCKRQFVRAHASETVGQKISSRPCPATRRPNGRPCRGRLADLVLDWEDELPDTDLDLSDAHSALAKVNVVFGSTLQIVPAGNLPLAAKRYDAEGAKVAIVNLQPTKHDKKADLVIHAFVDEVMERLLKELELGNIPDYNPAGDPIRLASKLESPSDYIEWTQDAKAAADAKRLADHVDDEWKRQRKAKKRRAESDRDHLEDSALSDAKGTQNVDDVDKVKETIQETKAPIKTDQSGLDNCLTATNVPCPDDGDGKVKVESNLRANDICDLTCPGEVTKTEVTIKEDSNPAPEDDMIAANAQFKSDDVKLRI